MIYIFSSIIEILRFAIQMIIHHVTTIHPFRIAGLVCRFLAQMSPVRVIVVTMTTVTAPILVKVIHAKKSLATRISAQTRQVEMSILLNVYVCCQLNYVAFFEPKVNNDIYVWSTYAYLPFLLFLGPYAELFSYRTAILVGISGRVVTRFLLLYGNTVSDMQVMQVTADSFHYLLTEA
jgi:hypothetical protein